jgi:peptide/nickel transport system permease protein
MIIGLFLGSIAGYYGGMIDSVVMRFVDIMLCFPTFFLILAVIAVLEPSIFNIMIVIGATSWMGVARLVRAEVLTLKERDFVAASRVMGASDAWIITKASDSRMPSGPVLVSATLGIGGAILTESALSFLGIGVQPPTPSWGNILMDGKSTLGVAWWLTIFPGTIYIIYGPFV